jgi:hypothetical protein
MERGAPKACKRCGGTEWYFHKRPLPRAFDLECKACAHARVVRQRSESPNGRRHADAAYNERRRQKRNERS